MRITAKAGSSGMVSSLRNRETSISGLQPNADATSSRTDSSWTADQQDFNNAQDVAFTVSICSTRVLLPEQPRNTSSRSTDALFTLSQDHDQIGSLANRHRFLQSDAMVGLEPGVRTQ